MPDLTVTTSCSRGDVTSLSKMSSQVSDEKVLDDVAGVTSYDEEIRKADRQRKQVRTTSNASR